MIIWGSSLGLYTLAIFHPLHRKRQQSPTFSTFMTNWSDVGDELSYCKKDHFAYIGTLFAVAYLYKQAFAIPGSLLLVKYSTTVKFGYSGTTCVFLSLTSPSSLKATNITPDVRSIALIPDWLGWRFWVRYIRNPAYVMWITGLYKTYLLKAFSRDWNPQSGMYEFRHNRESGID